MVSQRGSQVTAAPLGIAGAVGKRILVDEAVKMLFERPGHFAWTPRGRAIQQALGSLMGKALDPLAQRRIGKVEGLGDGGDVVAGDDLPNGLRVIRTMDAFETFFCKSDRISPSLPSSFDVLIAPLGRPSRLPRAFAAAKPSFVRCAIRLRSTSAKSPKSVIMALVTINRSPGRNASIISISSVLWEACLEEHSVATNSFTVTRYFWA